MVMGQDRRLPGQQRIERAGVLATLAGTAIDGVYVYVRPHTRRCLPRVHRSLDALVMPSVLNPPASCQGAPLLQLTDIRRDNLWWNRPPMNCKDCKVHPGRAASHGSSPISRRRPVYSGRGALAPALPAAAGVYQSVTSQMTTSWSP